MSSATVRTAPGRRKYTTDAQRLAARRASYRANAARQQALYYELCDQFGIQGQGARWASHLAEIRHLKPMPPENVALWRQFRYDPMLRWWLERFPLREIAAMGADLADVLEGAA